MSTALSPSGVAEGKGCEDGDAADAVVADVADGYSIGSDEGVEPPPVSVQDAKNMATASSSPSRAVTQMTVCAWYSPNTSRIAPQISPRVA